MILALALAPLVWLVRIGVLVAFAIPGVPLVAWQLRHVKTRESKRITGRQLLEFSAPWMSLFCNEEDGVDGLRGGDAAQGWWLTRTLAWSAGLRVFVWSALRNPVDSLRWIPVLNPLLVPARVRFVGLDHEPAAGENGWYFAWLAGTAYSCIRVERWGWRFWLGWKLHPGDAKGLQPGDVRAIRCDFAAQLKRAS